MLVGKLVAKFIKINKTFVIKNCMNIECKIAKQKNNLMEYKVAKKKLMQFICILRNIFKCLYYIYIIIFFIIFP